MEPERALGMSELLQRFRNAFQKESPRLSDAGDTAVWEAVREAARLDGAPEGVLQRALNRGTEDSWRIMRDRWCLYRQAAEMVSTSEGEEEQSACRTAAMDALSALADQLERFWGEVAPRDDRHAASPRTPVPWLASLWLTIRLTAQGAAALPSICRSLVDRIAEQASDIPNSRTLYFLCCLLQMVLLPVVRQTLSATAAARIAALLEEADAAAAAAALHLETCAVLAALQSDGHDAVAASVPVDDTFDPAALYRALKESRHRAGAQSRDTCRPSRCSFAQTGRSFHRQHWYFCYTCAPEESMGVCSSCARICHRGHQVVYAKYSRFFCDCGAGQLQLQPPAADPMEADLNELNELLCPLRQLCARMTRASICEQVPLATAASVRQLAMGVSRWCLGVRTAPIQPPHVHWLAPLRREMHALSGERLQRPRSGGIGDTVATLGLDAQLPVARSGDGEREPVLVCLADGLAVRFGTARAVPVEKLDESVPQSLATRQASSHIPHSASVQVEWIADLRGHQRVMVSACARQLRWAQRRPGCLLLLGHRPGLCRVLSCALTRPTASQNTAPAMDMPAQWDDLGLDRTAASIDAADDDWIASGAVSSPMSPARAFSQSARPPSTDADAFVGERSALRRPRARSPSRRVSGASAAPARAATSRPDSISPDRIAVTVAADLFYLDNGEHVGEAMWLDEYDDGAVLLLLLLGQSRTCVQLTRLPYACRCERCWWTRRETSGTEDDPFQERDCVGEPHDPYEMCAETMWFGWTPAATPEESGNAAALPLSAITYAVERDEEAVPVLWLFGATDDGVLYGRRYGAGALPRGEDAAVIDWSPIARVSTGIRFLHWSRDRSVLLSFGEDGQVHLLHAAPVWSGADIASDAIQRVVVEDTGDTLLMVRPAHGIAAHSPAPPPQCQCLPERASAATWETLVLVYRRSVVLLHLLGEGDTPPCGPWRRPDHRRRLVVSVIPSASELHTVRSATGVQYANATLLSEGNDPAGDDYTCTLLLMLTDASAHVVSLQSAPEERRWPARGQSPSPLGGEGAPWGVFECVPALDAERIAVDGELVDAEAAAMALPPEAVSSARYLLRFGPTARRARLTVRDTVGRARIGGVRLRVALLLVPEDSGSATEAATTTTSSSYVLRLWARGRQSEAPFMGTSTEALPRRRGMYRWCTLSVENLQQVMQEVSCWEMEVEVFPTGGESQSVGEIYLAIQEMAVHGVDNNNNNNDVAAEAEPEGDASRETADAAVAGACSSTEYHSVCGLHMAVALAFAARLGGQSLPVDREAVTALCAAVAAEQWYAYPPHGTAIDRARRMALQDALWALGDRDTAMMRRALAVARVEVARQRCAHPSLDAARDAGAGDRLRDLGFGQWLASASDSQPEEAVAGRRLVWRSFGAWTDSWAAANAYDMTYSERHRHGMESAVRCLWTSTALGQQVLLRRGLLHPSAAVRDAVCSAMVRMRAESATDEMAYDNMVVAYVAYVLAAVSDLVDALGDPIRTERVEYPEHALHLADHVVARLLQSPSASLHQACITQWCGTVVRLRHWVWSHVAESAGDSLGDGQWQPWAVWRAVATGLGRRERDAAPQRAGEGEVSAVDARALVQAVDILRTCLTMVRDASFWITDSVMDRVEALAQGVRCAVSILDDDAEVQTMLRTQLAPALSAYLVRCRVTEWPTCASFQLLRELYGDSSSDAAMRTVHDAALAYVHAQVRMLQRRVWRGGAPDAVSSSRREVAVSVNNVSLLVTALAEREPEMWTMALTQTPHRIRVVVEAAALAAELGEWHAGARLLRALRRGCAVRQLPQLLSRFPEAFGAASSGTLPSRAFDAEVERLLTSSCAALHAASPSAWQTWWEALLDAARYAPIADLLLSALDTVRHCHCPACRALPWRRRAYPLAQHWLSRSAPLASAVPRWLLERCTAFHPQRRRLELDARRGFLFASERCARCRRDATWALAERVRLTDTGAVMVRDSGEPLDTGLLDHQPADVCRRVWYTADSITCVFHSTQYVGAVDVEVLETFTSRRLRRVRVEYARGAVQPPAVAVADTEGEAPWQPFCTLYWAASGAAVGRQPSLPPAVRADALRLRMEHFSGALPPGTEAVLCLRCSRLTHERSGVCAHCRENVYQCRVCRYIHFDQLDAFLCAECGSSRHCRSRVHLWTRPVVRPTRDGRTYGAYRDAVLDALLTAHVDGVEQEGKAAGEMSSEKLWYVYCVAAADAQGDGRRVYHRERTVTRCIRCALQQRVDALNVIWWCEEGVPHGDGSGAWETEEMYARWWQLWRAEGDGRMEVWPAGASLETCLAASAVREPNEALSVEADSVHTSVQCAVRLWVRRWVWAQWQRAGWSIVHASRGRWPVWANHTHALPVRMLFQPLFGRLRALARQAVSNRPHWRLRLYDPRLLLGGVEWVRRTGQVGVLREYAELLSMPLPSEHPLATRLRSALLLDMCCWIRRFAYGMQVVEAVRHSGWWSPHWDAGLSHIAGDVRVAAAGLEQWAQMLQAMPPPPTERAVKVRAVTWLCDAYVLLQARAQHRPCADRVARVLRHWAAHDETLSCVMQRYAAAQLWRWAPSDHLSE